MDQDVFQVSSPIIENVLHMRLYLGVWLYPDERPGSWQPTEPKKRPDGCGPHAMQRPAGSHLHFNNVLNHV